MTTRRGGGAGKMIVKRGAIAWRRGRLLHEDRRGPLHRDELNRARIIPPPAFLIHDPNVQVSRTGGGGEGLQVT